MKVNNPLLKETFVFHPIEYHTNMLRYAGGKWIPDDGQLDLAFVYKENGFPFAEYVDLPYYTNILWSWLELLKGERIWHYYTTNNKYWYDYPFTRRDKHPNEVAGRSAMNKCSSLYHCANGRGIGIDEDNKYIQKRKLIILSSGKPVTKPQNPVCFLCLDNNLGHRKEALKRGLSKLENEGDYYQAGIKEAIQKKNEYEYTLGVLRAQIEEKRTELGLLG